MKSYAHQSRTDVSFIARRLRSDTTIHTLDLSHNELNDNSALQLASVLCVNQHLTALNLSHNRITDKGLGFLLQALQHRSFLRILHIGGNLDCTTRHVKDLLKTNLSHLIYKGTYIMEVDENLLTKWPPKTFDETVYQCMPPPTPGSFVFVDDVDWRMLCQTAYKTCEGHNLWAFFKTRAPPRNTYLDWSRTDKAYFEWHAVHEIISLSLVHHNVSPSQYEQLLRILQSIARHGWEHYSRISTCKMVE